MGHSHLELMRDEVGIGAAVIMRVLVNIDDGLSGRRRVEMGTAGEQRTRDGRRSRQEFAARKCIPAFLSSKLLHHARVKFP